VMCLLCFCARRTHTSAYNECSFFVFVYKGWESCVKFGPLLSCETLSDHSFAELVDPIRGALKKKKSEVNRWQT